MKTPERKKTSHGWAKLASVFRSINISLFFLRGWLLSLSIESHTREPSRQLPRFGWSTGLHLHGLQQYGDWGVSSQFGNVTTTIGVVVVTE